MSKLAEHKSLRQVCHACGGKILIAAGGSEIDMVNPGRGDDGHAGVIVRGGAVVVVAVIGDNGNGRLREPRDHQVS